MFAEADVVVDRGHALPALAPGADGDVRRRRRHATRSTGKLTLYCTTQAPHAHRTVYAIVAGLPEQKIRVITPDIGGGFGNKVARLPGLRVRDRRLDRRREAGQVGRGPLREPHVDRLRARLRDEGRDRGDQGRQDPRRPRGHDRRPRRVQRDGAADASTPAGFFHVFTGLLRPRGRALQASRASTRTRRPAGSPTPARSASPRPCTSSSAWSTCSPTSSGRTPAELRMKNLLRPEQFPYECQTGWVYDSGDYPTALQEGDGHDRLRGAAHASRPRSASAAS